MGNSALSNGEKGGQNRKLSDLLFSPYNETLENNNAEASDDSQSFPLTSDCYHYTRRAEVDWDIQK